MNTDFTGPHYIQFVNDKTDTIHLDYAVRDVNGHVTFLVDMVGNVYNFNNVLMFKKVTDNG